MWKTRLPLAKWSFFVAIIQLRFVNILFILTFFSPQWWKPLSCISKEQIVTHLRFHFAEFNSIFAEGLSSLSTQAFLCMLQTELDSVWLIASVPDLVSLLLLVATEAHCLVDPSEVSPFLWLCYLIPRPSFFLVFFDW